MTRAEATTRLGADSSEATRYFSEENKWQNWHLWSVKSVTHNQIMMTSAIMEINFLQLPSLLFKLLPTCQTKCVGTLLMNYNARPYTVDGKSHCAFVLLSQWWMTQSACQTFKWCLKKITIIIWSGAEQTKCLLVFSEVWIEFIFPACSAVRALSRRGFTDYHRCAGTVISAGLALFQVCPMLAIKSLTQHAPPGLLSHAVYITAAERTGHIR